MKNTYILTYLDSSSIFCVSVNIGCKTGAVAWMVSWGLSLIYKCRKCTCAIRPFEGVPAESARNESLEVVNKFCYLGDVISAAGGVEESIVAKIRCCWKNRTYIVHTLHCVHAMVSPLFKECRILSFMDLDQVKVYGSTSIFQQIDI